MMSSDMMGSWRKQALDALTTELLDVLIIGGGIVGAGVARDAAMRGIKVGLVEQYDFAQGTSSRSSRLLHGGLRYLAQGRLGLVREASMEKRVIQRIAPHLAEPLAFIFPTYRQEKEWKLWQLKLGVKIYDGLCGWNNLGRSQWLNRTQVGGLLRTLQTNDLMGAVRYFDGLTNDARLVIDTLRSAQNHGAMLCNHTKFMNAQKEVGEWRCEIFDGIGGERQSVRARWVVNAAGPWANGMPHSSIPLRLTKGVHLVIDRNRLPIPDAVVMADGRRILFAIPWGERVILGTTDTDFTGRIEDVRCEAEDVAYILGVVGKYFPASRIVVGDVISAWAGLRPLVANKNGHPSDTSRSHVIRLAGEQWLEVAGGKLTTYRLMAEQIVDQITRQLKRGQGQSHTAEEPLLKQAAVAGVSAIVPPEATKQTVEHYCRQEWAWHLEDVMVRRTSWHYYLRDPAATARKVADWMTEYLQWDERRKEEELDGYLRQSVPSWVRAKVQQQEKSCIDTKPSPVKLFT